MQRYFVPPEQFTKDRVIIADENVHHITKVLRSKPGDQIICSNGQGLDVLAEIIKLESEQVICRLVSRLQENREPTTEIILAQGLPKSDKMDFIIQKGTEIGISSFLPFTSERTIVQLNDKKEQKRLDRWQKIAREAAEQAHRSRIPNVLPVANWKQLLSFIEKQFTLIAYEQEDTMTLYQLLHQQGKVNKLLLVIGPEGGFSDQEVKEARNHGAISVSLGKRILRTETAGLVGAANIIYQLEGM